MMGPDGLSAAIDGDTVRVKSPKGRGEAGAEGSWRRCVKSGSGRFLHFRDDLAGRIAQIVGRNDRQA